MMHGRKNIKLHILYSIFFFRKSCRWWDNVEKYGTAGQATDDNTAHAQSTVNNEGQSRTLRICM